ncbi:MAG: hypothetical protein QM569_15270 [Acidovorax sp.]|uniref:hypothetical protein n=1 Tax=Acidovorax sp. TaxID=1872122 RepID=UPI0039E37124
MLDDLPATLPQVARHLDLAPSTIQRYVRTEQAPRTVMLALFWETQWGRSTADCEAANWALLQHARADGLGRYVRRLQTRIATLEAMLEDRAVQAANSPFFTVA